MLLIRPIPITPAMVTASNAGAADSDYSASTSYALGARVYLPADGRTYECVQAPALNRYPPSNPLYWIRAEPSNRYAMWDTEVSTASVVASSLTTTLTMAPRFNAAAFYGLRGTSITVTQKSEAGVTLKTETRALSSNPSGWYSYFFEPRSQVREAVFLSLVPSVGSRLEISITGPTAACSAVVVGNTFDLGEAQYGFGTSIVDYSRKTTTAAGVQSFEQGRYAKRMSGTLFIESARYNAVSAVLEGVRATPCAWIGVPGNGNFEPMSMLGVYRDFQIEVPGAVHRICSIEVESLT
jgi:hypothetical protein